MELLNVWLVVRGKLELDCKWYFRPTTIGGKIKKKLAGLVDRFKYKKVVGKWGLCNFNWDEQLINKSSNDSFKVYLSSNNHPLLNAKCFRPLHLTSDYTCDASKTWRKLRKEISLAFLGSITICILWCGIWEAKSHEKCSTPSWLPI